MFSEAGKYSHSIIGIISVVSQDMIHDIYILSNHAKMNKKAQMHKI